MMDSLSLYISKRFIAEKQLLNLAKNITVSTEEAKNTTIAISQITPSLAMPLSIRYLLQTIQKKQ